eukprot:TRINITY_DN9133_c0_g1_i1.p1 TRINITY_DN9133_c0_g1~~TRINITY_DN9133_c0_g1_i1.p1  ORF type:complete len:500 (-),score=129.72 TRINITY_DN9133_c0_g1_i1:16-1515(-)
MEPAARPAEAPSGYQVFYQLRFATPTGPLVADSSVDLVETQSLGVVQVRAAIFRNSTHALSAVQCDAAQLKLFEPGATDQLAATGVVPANTTAAQPLAVVVPHLAVAVAPAAAGPAARRVVPPRLRGSLNLSQDDTDDDLEAAGAQRNSRRLSEPTEPASKWSLRRMMTNVLINNQTSVLIRRTFNRFHTITHDNRVFYFRRKQRTAPAQGAPAATAGATAASPLLGGGREDSDDPFDDAGYAVIEAAFLRLLTTPKFRFFGLVFLCFQLFDNLMLIAILLSSLLDRPLDERIFEELALFVIVFADIYHTLLESTTKIWWLHRINMYLTLSVFGAYFAYLNFFSQSDSLYFFNLMLFIRFGAFVLETLTDYYIDVEVHRCILGESQSWLSPKLTEEENPMVVVAGAYGGSWCIWRLRAVEDGPLSETDATGGTNHTVVRWCAGILIVLSLALFLGVMALLMSPWIGIGCVVGLVRVATMTAPSAWTPRGSSRLLNEFLV